MKKSFDCIAVARAVKNRIEEEDQSLDWEKKSEKTRQIVEGGSLWLHLKGKVEVIVPGRIRRPH
jgi:hypothetical protein